jgi:hypothetical protein
LPDFQFEKVEMKQLPAEELPLSEAAPSECGAKIAGVQQQQQRLLAAQEGTAAPYRQLETSLLSLRLAIEGCGPAFEESHYFDETLLDLLSQAARHPSRFVREAAFHIINSLVAVYSAHRGHGTVGNNGGVSDRQAAMDEEEECYEMELDMEHVSLEGTCTASENLTQDTSSRGRNPLERFGVPLCQLLASGLADSTPNWAQVRYAQLLVKYICSDTGTIANDSV